MNLTFSQFLAEIPKADASLLPAQNAAFTLNVKLDRGTLRSFRRSKVYRPSTKPGDQLSVYRFAPVPGDPESGWLFSWPGVVDVVRGPVAGNTQDLTYWSGDGWPKFTDSSIATAGAALPSHWYRLGVLEPEYGPMVTIKNIPVEEPEDPEDPEVTATEEEVVDPEDPVVDPDDPVDEEVGDASTEIDRDYVITFLQTLGALVMEGPPSTPSEIITVPAGAGVNLTNIAEPTGDDYCWSGKRIYRRLYSGGLTQLSLVAEVPMGTVEYFDQLSDAEIPGDWLLSTNYYDPPEDLHSLGALSNGIMFGARDNDICLSEPYLPHAWSPFSRYPIPHKIVGMGQSSNQIIAITEKNPYLCVGTSPSAMSTVEVKIDQGCVSKRSIVSGIFGCAYASPDGMVLISAGGGSVITTDLMTRDQWQSLNPTSIIGAVNEGMYIGTFEQADGHRSTFMFDPTHKEAGIRYVDQIFTAAYHDGLLDSLLVYDPEQAQICLWDEGDDLEYTWMSKLNFFPRPVCFTAGRVEALSYENLHMQLITSQGMMSDVTVTGPDVFRFPAGYCDRLVQVKIYGTDQVRMISVGEQPHELD